MCYPIIRCNLPLALRQVKRMLDEDTAAEASSRGHRFLTVTELCGIVRRRAIF